MAGISKRFVRVGDRLIHYREAGAGPALVMLHDSPRSSRLYADILPDLAEHFRVVALDTPGYGLSSPLGLKRAEVGDFADALGEVLRALSLADAPLYARHTSAKIALEYAIRAAAPPPLLILDGLSIQTRLPDDAYIATYMQTPPIDDAGAFLATHWMRIRDMMRWFPWFDWRGEAHTRTAFPPMAWFEPYVLDALLAAPHYADAYSAAMRYLAGPALHRLRGKTVIAARSDDVLYASLDHVPADLGSHLICERLAPDDDQWLAWLISRVKQAHKGAEHSPAPAVSATLRADDPVYAAHPGGQMLVHRQGRPDAKPLLILDAPNHLQAGGWARALGAGARLIIPELPGYGESDPLAATAGTADYADALGAALASLGEARVDVLGLGLATPLALALAARHPARVDRLILDGAPTHPEGADPGSLFPDFPIDLSGAHWHRAWHYLRDAQCHWPWFDQSLEAQRRTDPVLGGADLYNALLGTLKQPQHYGDVARAGLREGLNIDGAGEGISSPALVFTRDDDRFYAESAALAARISGSAAATRPHAIAEAAAIVRAFLGSCS